MFSQEESPCSSQGSSPKPHSHPHGARKKKFQFYKYVNSDDDEADTLKDKFWRDLEQGKVDVFSRGDLYSKVKAMGRSTRPQSFKDMYTDRVYQPQNSVESQPKRKPRRKLSAEESGKKQKKNGSKEIQKGEGSTHCGERLCRKSEGRKSASYKRSKKSRAAAGIIEGEVPLCRSVPYQITLKSPKNPVNEISPYEPSLSEPFSSGDGMFEEVISGVKVAEESEDDHRKVELKQVVQVFNCLFLPLLFIRPFWTCDLELFILHFPSRNHPTFLYCSFVEH